MAFDKRSFNKTTREHFSAQGYTRHKNGKDYYIDCADGVTRLVVRVPDGMRGFFVGAQFADRGAFSGNFPETAVRWFAHETVLNGAAVMNYTDDDVAAGLTAVTEALAPYVASGKPEIAAHLNDFYHGDLDRWVVAAQDGSEAEADGWLVYLGFPPVDPYSDAYLAYTLEKLRGGATRCLPPDEYRAHRDFYDRYAAAGCRLTVDEQTGMVWVRME